ncbi:glucocorticoid modulatory element-binding protein 1-like isoform X2 [Periophthalmus magnuspinnatus]|uniref:glucocorticoid modulatory element-binding protein 1-like isoform X2 n=1 Tax=Periophthalmus magnuspinnatus TaxID=409849 RepID=UPI0024370F53|nr:glucocorticoid modulatory element-binding protein 1-like isoform X2 [Periophthalmus magnuspinnatus]
MLKKEESSPVILHLEPILHGINNETAGSGTVLAIETHHDESKAEGEETEYGYPITCGDSSAVLLIKKFVCPGINVRCVKFNNELISPKQFVYLSGKATLKDWKRAIRLGGVMLRKMMDSGQIDFYQHSTVCSNTCRSTKCDVPMSRAMVQPSPPSVTEDFNDAIGTEEHSEVKSGAETEDGATANQSPKLATTNGHPAKRERSDSPDGVLSLWKSVAESGLMGNVLSSVQTKLLLTLKEIEVRGLNDDLQLQDAVILNTLCEMFGLCESVKQAVELRRNLNEENRIDNPFYGMNRTLKKRKKMEKASTCKASSSKQPRLLPHGSPSNCLNILSPVTTNPAIFPLSAFGLSEHNISPLHFGPFSALISTDAATSRQLSDKSNMDGQKVKLERRVRESSNLRRQGVDEEDRGGRGVQREVRQSTGTFEKELQNRGEEAESNS